MFHKATAKERCERFRVWICLCESVLLFSIFSHIEDYTVQNLVPVDEFATSHPPLSTSRVFLNLFFLSRSGHEFERLGQDARAKLTLQCLPYRL